MLSVTGISTQYPPQSVQVLCYLSYFFTSEINSQSVYINVANLSSDTNTILNMHECMIAQKIKLKILTISFTKCRSFSVHVQQRL